MRERRTGTTDTNEDPAMFDSLLSPARCRQLSVAGALVAATMLAACDNNETTAPTTTKPTTANALKGGQIPPAVISLKVVDEKNAIVKFDGAMFEVTGPFGYHKIFYDNSYPEDGDPSLGSVKMIGMATGSYKVCQVGIALGFTFPVDGAQCFTGYLNPGNTLPFTFFNPRPAAVQWSAVTDVGTFLAGATFTVKDSIGAGATITDNQWPDSSPQDGSFQQIVYHPGTWTVCETVAPNGYVIPTGNPCKTVVVDWGGIVYAGTFANNLPYSLNFGVTEGTLDVNNNYIPLAGATFTVAYQRGLSKTTVADNGPNDYDPRPGRIAVKVGAAGSYTVCEVQAPVDHWLPKPPCQTINVAFNTPAFVGWFITPPSQVIYNP